MTTNVYDKGALKAGTDSRWSFNTDYAVFYVDDSGFEKIVDTEHAVFLFAGDSQVIQAWKEFLFDDSIKDDPGLSGIAMLMVDKSDGSVILEYGQDIQYPDATGAMVASFAGSGARHAAGCWIRNSCAVKSVDTAKLMDPYSGGETKFFELATKTGNLTQDVGLKGLNVAFMERGMVMYLTSGQNPVSIGEAAVNDDRVKNVVDQVAQGAVALSAPCDAQYMQPTAADKERLRSALGRIMQR
ncbi:hypothetical protein K3F43_10975 [Pseudomonas tussilaginis]|uniref:hypothetical protein n=1 Tax=unclassified Pseudomonas TaxID=196821 RepID=UPI000C6CED79|nr:MULTISPECIES: hypothetical protein [unclassified Pseudomonas]QYX49984.1 hypothetical protein K3F43_10975 [Pseudomonas sp. S11A 273]